MLRLGLSQVVEWSGSQVVRWSGSQIAKWSNRQTTRLQDYKTNRLPGYKTTRLEQGQSVLELMLALLVLIPLLIGGIELSRGVGIRQALDSGTHIASRSLSLEPGEWAWATATIQSSLDTNILGGGSVSSSTVRVYNASGAQITPATLNGLPFGSQFRLEAEVTYTPDIPLVGGQTITIRVSHWSIVERYP